MIVGALCRVSTVRLGEKAEHRGSYVRANRREKPLMYPGIRSIACGGGFQIKAERTEGAVGKEEQKRHSIMSSDVGH